MHTYENMRYRLPKNFISKERKNIVLMLLWNRQIISDHFGWLVDNRTKSFPNFVTIITSSFQIHEIVNSFQMQVYTENANLTITVHTDALAPYGARPSVGTATSEKLDVFATKLIQLLVIWNTLSLQMTLLKRPISSRKIALAPRQNDWHFTDDIFKCILVNENLSILNKIRLKFGPRDSIYK